MKILIPVFEFGRSGGYRVLSNLADNFLANGHEVVFLAPQSATAPYYPTSANILWFSSKGAISGIMLQDSIPQSIISTAKGMYCAFKQIMKENYFDIILTNVFLTVYPVFFAGVRRSSVFYYIQAYEPEFFKADNSTKSKLSYWASKLSYRLPFHKIVNADHYMNYKEIKTGKVVPPGLDFDIYHTEGRRTFMQDGILKMGTIGRNIPSKGTPFVVKAFQMLKAQGLPVELYVAFGEAEMEVGCEGLKTVAPHGDKNLADFYRSIDLYVSAVTVDGPAIHYPIIESMACGTAVISTPLYPTNDQNAYVVGRNIVEGVCDAVKEILRTKGDGQLQKKLLAGQQVVQQFDWKIISKKMLSYFEQEALALSESVAPDS